MLTAAGVVRLSRLNFVCIVATCRDNVVPLDTRLGLTEYVSPSARQLLCLAGSSWSFDGARSHLKSFAGLEASDELIRQVTLGEAPKMQAYLESAPESATLFREAVGELEFEVDATKVNTTEGWRDLKIALYSKRERGGKATSAQWATRQLPSPSARWALAGIEESESFATRWPTVARHLGFEAATANLSALADGAVWIWNRIKEEFPDAEQVLDVYHAIEHVADATKQYLGEGTTAQREQLQRGRERLLADGHEGIVEWLGEVSQLPVSVGGDGAALGKMLNYLTEHRERLNYALRLHRGQSIGSGMVEGAAKNLIGRRLKANNARWLVCNLNNMCTPCCCLYSVAWSNYWEMQWN